jgi:hypothetical protein
MGDCRYCGEPVGFLRSVHKECQTKHDFGKAEITSLVKRAAHDASAIGSLKPTSEGIAEKKFIQRSDISAAVIEGWEKAVDGAFEDGVLTKEEQTNLDEIQKLFALEQNDLDKNGAYTKLVKGAVLRELLSGNIPEKVSVKGNFPFNLQRDEKLVWLFQGVQYYEQKTRRHYEGGSSGVSIRVARGVYFRTSGFRAHPVETTENVHVGTGILALTNKHLYFAGGTKSFRVPYKKIVSFESYSDGIGIQRDAASAKPQTFVTGDGWFTYNLAMNLSQLSVIS